MDKYILTEKFIDILHIQQGKTYVDIHHTYITNKKQLFIIDNDKQTYEVIIVKYNQEKRKKSCLSQLIKWLRYG